MLVGIAGYGRMGTLIHQKALEQGHDVSVIIDRHSSSSNVTARELNANALPLDVIIDFTVPGAVLENVKKYAELKISAVIGTTGWYEDMASVAAIVENSDIGLIWGANFSPGVNLFLRLVETAAIMFNRFPLYDAAVHEVHHRHKEDSPSGTAEILAAIMLAALDGKEKTVKNSINRCICADELSVTSVRCGAVPGLHQVIFDSEVDTITLEHSARNRDGFAEGALLASEWICNRKGLYSIDDMMQFIIGGQNNANNR